MNVPILYYRFDWKRAKLNGPWAVTTWIISWANSVLTTMRFDWFLPSFRLALHHWLVSAGLRHEN